MSFLLESLDRLDRCLGQQMIGPVPGFMGSDLVIGGF